MTDQMTNTSLFDACIENLWIKFEHSGLADDALPQALMLPGVLKFIEMHALPVDDDAIVDQLVNELRATARGSKPTLLQLIGAVNEYGTLKQGASVTAIRHHREQCRIFLIGLFAGEMFIRMSTREAGPDPQITSAAGTC